MKIDIRGLKKSFGRNEVLRGVDLSIEKGGVSVILGGSGTGKSVLLRHINGLLRPDAGTITVDGTEISGLSERNLNPIRARMGYIFQFGGLLHSLDVGGNVGLALREKRLKSRDEIEKIVSEKLKAVGLEGKEREHPSNLSGGMQKRVAIARALASGPELLLYDEPTAGLDPPTADSIDRLIAQVANEMGVTSIVVTHDMLTVFSIADRVHYLHEGRILISGTPDEILASDHEVLRKFLARDTGSRGDGLKKREENSPQGQREQFTTESQRAQRNRLGTADGE